MKQLNTYLEGLLSNTNKNSTRSAFTDQISEYVKRCFERYPTTRHITCEVSSKTVTIINNKNTSNICWGKMVSDLINKYDIKKIILQGNWDLYVDSGISDFPIDLECDDHLVIGSSFTEKNSSTINNMNIKVKHLYITQKIKLNNSQIQSDDVIEIRRPTQIAKCKTQAERIVMNTSGIKSSLNSLIKTKVPFVKSDNTIHRKDWSIKEPNRIKEIKGIDPIKELEFKDLNTENIITGNIYSDIDTLVFTKNPKSYQPKYPDVYEMKNGWSAIWLDSKDIRKQFGL